MDYYTLYTLYNIRPGQYSQASKFNFKFNQIKLGDNRLFQMPFT